jgi:hypothetical protein
MLQLKGLVCTLSESPGRHKDQDAEDAGGRTMIQWGQETSLGSIQADEQRDWEQSVPPIVGEWVFCADKKPVTPGGIRLWFAVWVPNAASALPIRAVLWRGLARALAYCWLSP